MFRTVSLSIIRSLAL